MFYVYVHKRLDFNTVFYVGKGSGNRFVSKRYRNKYWHNIVEKCGYTAEIVKHFEFEKDALAYEIQLISEYRKLNQCEANLNEGGTGLSGRKHTAESIAKISARSAGSRNPMFGLKRPHSTQEILKMRGSHHPFSKKVIDTITLKVYPSVGEASRQLNLNPGHLAKMLRGFRNNKTSLVYLENLDEFTIKK